MVKDIKNTRNETKQPVQPSRDFIKDQMKPQGRTSESTIGKKEGLYTMNGRSYEMIDPEKVKGPYLTAEFEAKILRRQGFSSEMVHLVEPPSSRYNPLGYALFGRGAITREEAGKVLAENFVPEAPARPEYGRVFRDDPETKTLTGGWIERMSDDGRVTEIRCQWRERGAIWKHHPDLLGEGWQTYREKTPWDKWELVQVRGKARLEDAKEIFVGEEHSNRDHHKRIQAAIKHIAKKGDVVLVEGVESGVERHQSMYPDIPEEIPLIGWDNMKIREKLPNVHEREDELINKSNEALQARNMKKYIEYEKGLKSFQNNLTQKIFTERNKTLDETLAKTRAQFPDAKIIIIAGAGHFSPSSTLRERLEAHTAAVFMPRDTVARLNAAKALQVLPEWLQ